MAAISVSLTAMRELCAGTIQKFSNDKLLLEPCPFCNLVSANCSKCLIPPSLCRDSEEKPGWLQTYCFDCLDPERKGYIWAHDIPQIKRNAIIYYFNLAEINGKFDESETAKLLAILNQPDPPKEGN